MRKREMNAILAMFLIVTAGSALAQPKPPAPGEWSKWTDYHGVVYKAFLVPSQRVIWDSLCEYERIEVSVRKMKISTRGSTTRTVFQAKMDVFCQGEFTPHAIGESESDTTWTETGSFVEINATIELDIYGTNESKTVTVHLLFDKALGPLDSWSRSDKESSESGGTLHEVKGSMEKVYWADTTVAEIDSKPVLYMDGGLRTDTKMSIRTRGVARSIESLNLISRWPN